jgi:hypothetical protein
MMAVLYWSTQFGDYYGENDADTDICDCWSKGYTGSGVKIGVIDFGGVEFSHPDLINQNIPKVYNAVTSFYETSDFAINPNYDHTMQVIGVINAQQNNANPSSSGADLKIAIESAYNATVIPYINESIGKNNPSQSSIANVTQSLQAAFIEGVDIINMSFYVDMLVGSIETQVNNAVSNGRPYMSDNQGIVYVSSVGNTDIPESYFPANMDNVIGVGWTNPEDYRSSYTSPAPSGRG